MIKRYRNRAKLLNVIVFLIGACVIVGWLVDMEFLKRPLPNTVAMNPATAAAFILSAMALFLTISNNPSKKIAGNVFAIIVLMIGSIKFWGIIVGFDMQIDQILFSSKLNSELAKHQLNRMAPNTAFCFMFSGVALLLMNSKKIMSAHFFTILITLCALLSLLGYGYQVKGLSNILTFIPMAIHTAFGFLCFSVALLFTYPDNGLMKVFTSPYEGSTSARKILPVAIVVPILLGFLRIYTTDTGLIPHELGTALFIISVIIIFLIYIYNNAEALNKKDIKRKAAENTIIESQQLLQSIIDNTSSFIYVKDLEGKYIMVNNTYSKMFGMSKTEVIGKTAFDLTDHESALKLKQQDEDILKENKMLETEIRTTLMGEPRDFFSVRFPVKNAEGNVYATGGIFTDVTEIKKQSDLIHDLYDNAPAGYYSLDTNGKFINANNTTLKWLGYEKHELVGKPIIEILGSESIDAFKQSFPVFKEKGIINDLELYYKRKDGSVFPVLINASAVKNEFGDFLYSRSTIFDITDRKKLEDALKNSNDKFLKLFYSSPLAMVIRNIEDGVILDVNEEYERLLGYKKQDLIGNTSTGMGMIVDEGFSENLRKTALQKRSLKNIEATLYNSKNEAINVIVSIETIRLDNKDCILSAILDITERKKLEKDLWKSEQRFRQIVETAQEGIWTIDENNKTNFVNKKMAQLLEYTEEEMLGKTLIEFMDEEGIALALEIMERQKHETLERNEYKYITKSGRQIWADIASNAIVGGDKTYKGAIALVTDITQRKQIDEQLKELNKELESFTYSVSHDLRAPLRIINGYAEMIKDTADVNLSDEPKRMLENIIINAKRMGTLIDDLLNFSRLGRRELVTHETDMNAIVQPILEQHLEGKENYTVKVENLPESYCDSNLIKQVWGNLISNAVKYSTNNPTPFIEIGSVIENNKPVYYVKDNGAGFDMKYYDKLFGVFQRLHKATEFEGTGVGLALSQRIIAKHGGKIWAESKINEGSTFYFTL